MRQTHRPLIRAQVLAMVLRGFLQTRGAFFTSYDVVRVAKLLEDDCLVPGVSRKPRYNEFPEGY